MPHEPLIPLDAFRTIADGLDHPEAVGCGPDGTLWAGGEAGQVYRIGADGAVETFANTGGFVLGLCFDAEGSVYACDNGRKEVVRIDHAGNVSTWSGGSPERPFAVPNYPVFLPDGTMFVSDSGGWDANAGFLYRIAPDRTTSLVPHDLAAFPNGLAVDPANRWLYVVLSQIPGVVRLPLDRAGNPGAPEPVVQLPGNVPDGLAFDEAGNLVISCYTPSVIYRLDGGAPGGRLSVLAADVANTIIATPTNIAFTGADRRTLVAASLSRWHLAATTVESPGARLNYPSFG
jgi:gluconolactonase